MQLANKGEEGTGTICCRAESPEVEPAICQSVQDKQYNLA
jgi:hypothetical protein